MLHDHGSLLERIYAHVKHPSSATCYVATANDLPGRVVRRWKRAAEVPAEMAAASGSSPYSQLWKLAPTAAEVSGKASPAAFASGADSPSVTPVRKRDRNGEDCWDSHSGGGGGGSRSGGGGSWSGGGGGGRSGGDVRRIRVTAGQRTALLKRLKRDALWLRQNQLTSYGLVVGLRQYATIEEAVNAAAQGHDSALGKVLEQSVQAAAVAEALATEQRRSKGMAHHRWFSSPAKTKLSAAALASAADTGAADAGNADAGNADASAESMMQPLLPLMNTAAASTSTLASGSGSRSRSGSDQSEVVQVLNLCLRGFLDSERASW